MKKHNLKNRGHSINFRKLAKPAVLCFSAIFIISMLSFLATTSVQAATVPSFGNTAIGTNPAHNDANAQSVSYFKCSTTGSVTDIMAYIDGASSGKAIAALYAVKGSSAGALLEQTNAISIGTTFSWVDFKLSSPYSVTSGTTYGLAIMGSISINVKEVSGTGQRDHNAVSSYANGFANPFGTIWGTDMNGAMSIYVLASSSPTPTSTPTSTLTPTPTPTVSANNLAPFNPSAVYPTTPAWLTYNYYQESVDANIHADTSTVFNGQTSVRIDSIGSSTNTGRECDGPWIVVSPGQTVTFTAYMKTQASTLGDTNPESGARIGIDFYDTKGNYATGISYAGQYTTNPTTAQYAGNYVPWGTGTWTLRTISFTVPSTVYDPNGTPHTPGAIIPWMQLWSCVRGGADGAIGWFANPQVTITK